MMIDSEIRLEITDAIHRFYYLVDDGAAADTPVFFAPDAEWIFGPGTPNPGTLRGSDIDKAMEARGASKEIFTRHLVSNLVLTSSQQEVIDARYILLLFRAKESDRLDVSRIVADVSEQWCQVDGEWRIQRRTVFPSFH